MMNTAAAIRLTEGFLKGTFDVIDAMMGVTSTYGEIEALPVTPADLAAVSAQFPFAMHARFKAGGGGVAMLLTIQDAARLASLVLAGVATPKDSLDDAELSSIKEIADPCMGGGISNWQENLRADVELTDLQITSASPLDFAARLGEAVSATRFAYTIPTDISGHGVLVMADRLEKFVPAIAGASAAPETPQQPNPVAQETAMSSPPARPYEPLPDNMDMILDIRLLATARLGRIEMPIGDILSLGPGSIFEVGRAVDEPIDLLINDKLIARGDVVVVDEKFGIRITEIVSTRERIESLR